MLKILKMMKQKGKSSEKRQKKAEENFQERMAKKKNANSKSRIKSAPSYAGRTKKNALNSFSF